LRIEKLKSHKSPGIYQTPAELIKAGNTTIRSGIHKVIISVWNKEKLSEDWKQWIIVPIHKKGNKTVCSNYRGISFSQQCTKYYRKQFMKAYVLVRKEFLYNILTEFFIPLNW
jgi:hypothetical protein